MNDFKPKRYVVEMCNDQIKQFEAAGDTAAVDRLERVRNGYIMAELTPKEVIMELYNLLFVK